MTALQTSWGSIRIQADSGDGQHPRIRTADGNEEFGEWRSISARGRGDWTDAITLRNALSDCADAEGLDDCADLIEAAMNAAEEILEL